MAIECLAACAPAAKMDVQSVDMCLLTASLHRFHFSWPSSELGEEMSVASWDDGDLEGLGAGISVPPSWHKCYGVCSMSEGNALPEVDAWKVKLGKMR